MKILSPRIITILVIGFPLILALRTVLSGEIPFWFDPGRDLQLAADNLHKISLIGPPSGIPGFFYGPYWIWLLSFGMLFSKDPRIIDLIALVIPYFVIFPFILFKFSRLLSRPVVIVAWLLFIFNCFAYATQLWNPHLAPLLTLASFYLLISANFIDAKRVDYFKLLVAGIALGLLLNFHISFGIGVALGSFIFILTQYFFLLKNERKSKQPLWTGLISILFFLAGLIVVQLPFVIFEMRHGFQQIRTAFQTITSAGAVVGVTGLTRSQIINHFFSVFGKALGVPENLRLLPSLFIPIFFYQIIKQKKGSLSNEEKKFFLLLASISFSILFIYLTSKNPVWDYHFISIEILFVLLTAFIMSKLAYVRKILYVWVVVLIFINISSFIKGFQEKPYSVPTLKTKNHIVDTVLDDAHDKEYTVFVYSPFIYTHDFSYLFKWRGEKDVPYDPGSIPMGSELVYLIIPESSKNVSKKDREDFINYRTPKTTYRTTKSWNINDGSLILKREKITPVVK